MKFTTPCFVRVENPQERKELSEWLKSIGRTRIPHSKRDRAMYFRVHAEGTEYEQNNKYCMFVPLLIDRGYIDCGTNIPLFKALAAMNDSNDNYQWFYDPMGAKLSPKVGSAMNYNHVGKVTGWSGVRKATEKEIISHFDSRKV